MKSTHTGLTQMQQAQDRPGGSKLKTDKWRKTGETHIQKLIEKI